MPVSTYNTTLHEIQRHNARLKTTEDNPQGQEPQEDDEQQESANSDSEKPDEEDTHPGTAGEPGQPRSPIHSPYFKLLDDDNRSQQPKAEPSSQVDLESSDSPVDKLPPATEGEKNGVMHTLDHNSPPVSH